MGNRLNELENHLQLGILINIHFSLLFYVVMVNYRNVTRLSLVYRGENVFVLFF